MTGDRFCPGSELGTRPHFETRTETHPACTEGHLSAGLNKYLTVSCKAGRGRYGMQSRTKSETTDEQGLGLARLVLPVTGITQAVAIEITLLRIIIQGTVITRVEDQISVAIG